MRILSWNLLKTIGGTVTDVRRLVERHHPDLVLLQETTALIDALPDLIGGQYVRKTMEGRGHGPAAWSSQPFEAATVALPAGSVARPAGSSLSGHVSTSCPCHTPEFLGCG